MRRSSLVSIAILGVVIAAAVGWLAGSRIKSPADRAAETAAPAASRITVDVVEVELTADVVTRGDVVFDLPVDLELSGSFAVAPERLVVTESRQIGDQLAEGSVAVEVAGRPVFILAGELPMYRDMRPGAVGDDVLQLEQALVRLGFLDVEADETWDAATGSAVDAWYTANGYPSIGPSVDDEQLLSAARDRVRAAEGSIADLESSLRQAEQGSGQSGVAQARAQVTQAENALTLAEVDAARAIEVAEVAVAEAEAAVVEAEKALADAEPSDKAAAEAVVDDALAQLEQANFDKTRTEIEQAALLQTARDQVEVANAAVADAQTGTDTGPLRRQLASARLEQSQAVEELRNLEETSGTWLPAGEVVFVATTPVLVNQVHSGRGSTIAGPYLTVTGSDLYVSSSVSMIDAPRIETGMPAQIDDPASGDLLAATVRTVATGPGTNGVSPDHIYVDLEPVDSFAHLVGENIRVVIPVSSTGGLVLAVPIAALSTTAEGSVVLQVEDDDGNLRVVEVEPGLSADGMVEVTPVDGELRVGEWVVVGHDWAAGAAGNDVGAP